MAADIYIHGQSWSAQNWLFDQIVALTAQAVTDTTLRARLQEIVDAHLGSLNVQDFSSDEQTAIHEAMASSIPQLEDMDFDDPNVKASTIEALQQLKTLLQS